MLQMSGLQEKNINHLGQVPRNRFNLLGPNCKHCQIRIIKGPLPKKVETSGPTDHLKTSNSSEMLKKLSCLDRGFKGFWLGFLGVSSDWVSREGRPDTGSEFSDLQIFI